MSQFIKYPSIEQFRDIIRSVTSRTRFDGLDEQGNAVFVNRPLPIIEAVAVEKIHGTNAAVCYSNKDGFWVQKRTSVCTIESDNAGCAFTAYAIQDVWVRLMKELAEHHGIDLDKNIITIFYEWCGGNIQKNSAVSNLSKRSIIFMHAKVTNEDGSTKWIKTTTDKPISDEDSLIFNIQDFPTYNITIDFNNSHVAQNQLVDLVLNTIEPNSPVGRQFGVDGNIGEGVVVSFMIEDDLYQFKVKGEKHSATKVKTLAAVDDVQIQRLNELAQQVTPAWRLEQMYALANDTINGKEPDVRNIGAFLKMVNQDIAKEEMQMIHELGVDFKALCKPVSTIARMYFMEQLNAG